MKGWRTIILNGGLVVVTALLPFLAQVDWVGTVGGTAAVIVTAAINIALRVFTTTPIGAKE